ncbi:MULTISPECIES: hypothetical protein [unclassified Flavobacterium]|uniref:hypothetical protein n=1 Tax=unclassified Flavobacterium TaxID=196869 RepID=UPI0012A885EB|nr:MULTISPECIES: hypothetical protein [unclassified Flavobacterium]MBF4484653.1 hypothetical protein [Flavobacterium sp. CSZ]QGK75795.1 hypothetical protein GIY83_17460 [Flavobacterium sp. SLB02]
MKTLNSIAVEYLLRNDSQKSNNKSEDITREVTRLNAEQAVIKSQKSLLLLMYNLEEEGEDFFLQ